MGPTAIIASAGCRTVTQKKTARTVRAAAMVVMIASVCRSVIASVTVTVTVTVTEMMLSEVAVRASSSPNQSASMSSWIALVRVASPE